MQLVIIHMQLNNTTTLGLAPIGGKVLPRFGQGSTPLHGGTKIYVAGQGGGLLWVTRRFCIWVDPFSDPTVGWFFRHPKRTQNDLVRFGLQNQVLLFF